MKLYTPKKTILKEWLLSSLSYYHVVYYKIPYFLPQLYAGEKAIRIAINNIRYCRHVTRKKGFSNDPKVIKERLKLAKEGLTWPRPYV